MCTNLSSSLKKRMRKDSSQHVVDKRGNLDVSNIPHHLRPIVQRNFNDSPLLRLPGELRNIIWSYVMDDFEIGITGIDGISLGRSWLGPTPAAQRQIRRVFRVPQVCRQIYADTHLLLYARAKVVLQLSFVQWDIPPAVIPVESLTEEQKNAITRVRLGCVKDNKLPVLRKTFPSLASITYSICLEDFPYLSWAREWTDETAKRIDEARAHNLRVMVRTCTRRDLPTKRLLALKEGLVEAVGGLKPEEYRVIQGCLCD